MRPAPPEHDHSVQAYGAKKPTAPMAPDGRYASDVLAGRLVAGR